MVIFIAGVNIHNHTLVYDIAGLAGYALSSEVVDETTFKIDLNSAKHRKRAGIKESDVLLMIQEFLNAGFKIHLEK
ncbi:TPA: hypothetical protein LDJ28_001237 [Salmonella enterica subsp. enterica serovar Infantis]|nr:hypothetical protein [Salmonella enterica subsp. enterica serovar Infantis]